MHLCLVLRASLAYIGQQLHQTVYSARLFSSTTDPLGRSARSREHPKTLKFFWKGADLDPVFAWRHPSKSRSWLAAWSASSLNPCGWNMGKSSKKTPQARNGQHLVHQKPQASGHPVEAVHRSAGAKHEGIGNVKLRAPLRVVVEDHGQVPIRRVDGHLLVCLTQVQALPKPRLHRMARGSRRQPVCKVKGLELQIRGHWIGLIDLGLQAGRWGATSTRHPEPGRIDGPRTNHPDPNGLSPHSHS